MSNWAVLLQDLLIRIAERVDFLEDFSSFGRVCRSWRSVAVKENFKGSQQLPWLMLAEDDDNNFRRFVSAPEGNPIDNLLLPEAKGKRCFETLGWLVTLSETGDMNLLHPISRVQIPLPHISTFKYYLEGNVPNNFHFIRKAVLSSRPYVSSKENNFVLMVIHDGCGYLGFWKPGDKAWTTIETHPAAFSDITYYNGQFYAINFAGNIFVYDVGGRDPTVAHLVGGIPFEILAYKRAYIVESKGEVLVVVRDGYDLIFLGDYGDEEDTVTDFDESRIDYGTSEFRVFKVDLTKREWVKLQSLGDNALFVGDNASISVQAIESQGIKSNCIYFTDDCWPAYAKSSKEEGKTWVSTTWKIEVWLLAIKAALLVASVHLYGSDRISDVLHCYLRDMICPTYVEVMIEDIRGLARRFASCSFRFVRRSANSVADNLARHGVRGSGSKTWEARPPS